MVIEETMLRLKDGRSALLRSPCGEDVDDVLALLRRTAEETDFMLRYPEECTYTHDEEAAILERRNASPDGATILCVVDGAVAGICSIAFETHLKMRHRCQIAIGIARDHWDLGIGTGMLRELIRIAEGREGVVQMELTFIEGNVRARALYEKLGFRICAVLPRAIRKKDGSYLNEYLMIRDLDIPGGCRDGS